MNAETARLLAQSLRMRAQAEAGLLRLARTSASYIENSPRIRASMVTLARTYVHEQRVINRILSEDADEE